MKDIINEIKLTEMLSNSKMYFNSNFNPTSTSKSWFQLPDDLVAKFDSELYDIRDPRRFAWLAQDIADNNEGDGNGPGTICITIGMAKYGYFKSDGRGYIYDGGRLDNTSYTPRGAVHKKEELLK